MKKFVAIAATFAAASVALAQGTTETKTYFGQGGPVADGPGPVATRFDLFVPDHGTIVDFKQLCVDMTHTWVADLDITLVAKDSGGIAVMVLNYVPSSDDLDGIYCWQDGAPLMADDPADGLIDPGTYGTEGPGVLDDFNGIDKFGRWSLIIRDWAGADVGFVRGWSITMNNIPEPSSLGLLALGALGFIRRR